MGKYLLSYYTNLPLNSPEMVNIGLTHACNFNCDICNTREESPNWKDQIEFKTIKKVLREIAEWDNDIGVSFAGGEPLLRKDVLFKSLRYADNKGLTTYLTTNCGFLNEETSKKLVKNGLDFISLSLDGYTKDTNDYIRSDGSYDSVISAIDNLKKWKNELGKNINIGLTTIITSKNLDELVDLHKFAKDRDLYEINFNPYVPDNSFMGKVDYDNDEFWINENLDKLNTVMNKLIEIKKSDEGIIGTSEFILSNTYDYFKQRNRFERGKCLAGQAYMYIKPNGNVDVCGKGPSYDIRPMNVKDKNLKEIWRSINFFWTRLKVKMCDEPCLMVCFPKVNTKDFVKRVTN